MEIFLFDSIYFKELRKQISKLYEQRLYQYLILIDHPKLHLTSPSSK